MGPGPQREGKKMSAYYMTSKMPSQDGNWEQCNAATETAAKAEATRRFGMGPMDATIMIARADERGVRHVVAWRKNFVRQWTDATGFGITA